MTPPLLTDLTATPFDPELTPGAFNAVNTCLRIQPNEKVTVITDVACLEIAASIVQELTKVGSPYKAFVLEEVAERPLTGVGAGAFLPAWGRYAPLEAGGHRYVAHNVPLEILGELGIPALILFATFVLALMVRLWRAGADPLVGPEARAVFAGLAGYLVCELVNGYSLSWFLYFLFACAAAAIHVAALRRRSQAEPEA